LPYSACFGTDFQVIKLQYWNNINIYFIYNSHCFKFLNKLDFVPHFLFTSIYQQHVWYIKSYQTLLTKSEIELAQNNRASVILHSTMNGIYFILLKGFFNVIASVARCELNSNMCVRRRINAFCLYDQYQLEMDSKFQHRMDNRSEVQEIAFQFE
jgi:hypothetical protein